MNLQQQIFNVLHSIVLHSRREIARNEQHLEAKGRD